LGLSTTDILASISYAIRQFLFPSERGYSWAFGGQSSCRINGFLKSFTAVWNFWNNGVLSYYFLLTVISQVRRKNYVRKCEPFMHLSGLFFPITAIMGLFLGWYPEDDPCVMVDELAIWITAGVPTLFVFLSLIINNMVIYAVLRKSLQSIEEVAGPTLAQKRIKREARTIMFLYVGSFFVTVSPAFVERLLEVYSGYTAGNRGKIYPVIVLRSIFLPLQGFFTFLIYITPSYTRFRAANPNKPMHFVLHQALFNPRAPRLYNRRDANDANRIIEGSVGIAELSFADNNVNQSELLFYVKTN